MTIMTFTNNIECTLEGNDNDSAENYEIKAIKQMFITVVTELRLIVA